MDLFDAIKERRSVRQFTEEPVPSEVIDKALDAALLAPNSSNLQTWDFYWVQSAEKKKELVKSCLSQAAARKAAELIVITADPKKWKRVNSELISFARSVNAHPKVLDYYERFIPLDYKWGVATPVKWFLTSLMGLKKPMQRRFSFRTYQEVAMKSAALACENFALAITAQGYSSCMMEGFDEKRVKKLLSLPRSTRVVMVIAVGRAKGLGTWGERFRIDREKVIHKL